MADERQQAGDEIRVSEEIVNAEIQASHDFDPGRNDSGMAIGVRRAMEAAHRKVVSQAPLSWVVEQASTPARQPG